MPDRPEVSARRRVNLGDSERGLSVAVGALLLLRSGVLPAIGPLLLAAGGAALIWRGVSGYCVVKQRLCEEARVGRAPADAAADPVARASEDSFPASDPPSWTPVSGSTQTH